MPFFSDQVQAFALFEHLFGVVDATDDVDEACVEAGGGTAAF